MTLKRARELKGNANAVLFGDERVTISEIVLDRVVEVEFNDGSYTKLVHPLWLKEAIK